MSAGVPSGSLSQSGPSAPIDVAEIDRELEKLWQAAATENASGAGVTRVRLANVIVYAEDEAGEKAAEALFERLPEQMPSRAILVRANPKAARTRLSAWVSARCRVALAGQPQVCSEEITIEADAASPIQLAGALTPLLVGSLPVALWWPGVPRLPDPMMARFAQDLVDRVLLDSAALPDAVTGLAALDDWARRHEKNAALGDINWSRLISWRLLIAQFFDAPAALSYLPKLDRVEIEFARRDTPSARALLLLGWLASRLGWQLDPGSAWYDGERAELSFRREGGTVAVYLQPVPLEADEQLGRVMALRLLAGQGPTAARFALERTEDRDYVLTRVQMPDGGAAERLTPLETPSDAELVISQLIWPTYQPNYQQALAVAAEVARALQTGPHA